MSIIDLQVPATGQDDPSPAQAADVDGTPRFGKVKTYVPSIIGVVGLLVVWEVVGLTIFKDTKTIPAPTAIIKTMIEDGWEFYRPNIEATLSNAAWGWFYGNAAAIVLAVAFVQVPFLEKALMQLAVTTYCLPVLVVATVLNINMQGDAPKIIVAALAVFFTTLVGMLLGLKSADRTSLDLVRAYGGGKWVQLWKVRLRASLPSLFAGLRIAAPAAMLGAIVGEWMGSETGLGVAMIAAQSSLQIERTWGIALTATALSGVFYAITAIIGNRLTTWAPKVQR